MKDQSPKAGLSLHQAAQRFNVPFSREAIPRSQEVVAGDLRLHYLEWGNENGQTLVMLHGIAQQAHSWDFTSLALADRYRIIALDARGHGNSQWPTDGDYSLEAHQKDLDAFSEALGLSDFILVGHSMGGRNGYVFTHRRPELVKALVIVDTGPQGATLGRGRIRRFMTLPDEMDSYEEFAHRVQEYTKRPMWLVHGSLEHSIRRLPNGKWTWKYDKAIRSPSFNSPSWPEEKLWKCLEGIGCPTLVVRGDRSDVLSQETYEKMLSLIPKAQGGVVPDAGHLVPGDNARGFIGVLESFLEALG